jgi:hypothetical protein
VLLNRRSAPFRPFAATALLAFVFLSGCVADDEVDKATTQFTQAATTLTQTYKSLLQNANLVEVQNFIDSQAFGAIMNASAGEADRKPTQSFQITGPGLSGTALLTPAEITLRTTAIKALTDYTTALSTLAAGKSATQTQADAATASANIKSFATDLTTVAVTVPKGGTPPNFAGPASLAATAIGDILKVIEDHRSATEIRNSIKANDPKVTPLFRAMEAESAYYFTREAQQQRQVEILLLQQYNTAIDDRPINQVRILQLNDRLQRYEAQLTSSSTSDPTQAVKAFESAHTALISLITATKSDDKRKLLSQLLEEVKSFCAEVSTSAKAATPSNP